MAYGRDWLEVNPIDHTKFSAQPGNVRKHKVDISDRLKNLFHGFISGETQTDEGVKVLPFVVESGDPGATANKIKLYAKDVNSKVEFFIEDEDGNIYQITSKGKILLDNGRLSNNTNLIGRNNADDGNVSLIKVNSSDVVVIPDGTETNSNAAPTSENDVSNKKYVDDQISSNAQSQDSIIKAWVNFAGSNGSATDALNATVVRNTTGTYTVSWGTDFADTNYCIVISVEEDDNNIQWIFTSKLAGSVVIKTFKTTSLFDVASVSVIAIGDQ